MAEGLGDSSTLGMVFFRPARGRVLGTIDGAPEQRTAERPRDGGSTEGCLVRDCTEGYRKRDFIEDFKARDPGGAQVVGTIDGVSECRTSPRP